MLLRCSLTHETIVLLRHISYAVYMYPCLGLGLFMSYICNLFFIFSLIVLVFFHFLDYLLLFLDDSVDKENE